MTLDKFGHLFEGQDEELAERLDGILTGENRTWSATWPSDNVVELNSQVTGG
jgi:hypothetical protein